MNKYKDNKDYFLSEDEKYGGLEANNLQEAMDYFNIEDIHEIRTKSDDNLNIKIESDYHNTYYKGKGNYGIRELRMNNKKWHEKNK